MALPAALLSAFLVGPGPGRSADTSAAGEPVRLQPKWVVGDRIVHRMTLAQEQKIPVPGATEPMKQETTQLQEVTITVVKERDGGGQELELEFSRMELESRMGGQTMLSFDSRKDPKDDEGNPLAPMLRALTGAKLRVLTRSDGTVDRVDGMKELAAKITVDLPPMFAGLKDTMMNEDVVKQMGLFPAGLPEDPVKVGDSWPVTQDVKLGPLGNLKVSMTVTFRGWEERMGRRCAALDHKGRMWSLPAAANTATAVSIAGDTKGTSWFDPAAGVSVEGNALQNLQIKVKAMGNEMQIQSVQSLTNQLVQLGKAK